MAPPIPPGVDAVDHESQYDPIDIDSLKRPSQQMWFSNEPHGALLTGEPTQRTPRSHQAARQLFFDHNSMSITRRAAIKRPASDERAKAEPGKRVVDSYCCSGFCPDGTGCPGRWHAILHIDDKRVEVDATPCHDNCSTRVQADETLPHKGWVSDKSLARPDLTAMLQRIRHRSGRAAFVARPVGGCLLYTCPVATCNGYVLFESHKPPFRCIESIRCDCSDAKIQVRRNRLTNLITVQHTVGQTQEFDAKLRGITSKNVRKGQCVTCFQFDDTCHAVCDHPHVMCRPCMEGFSRNSVRGYPSNCWISPHPTGHEMQWLPDDIHPMYFVPPAKCPYCNGRITSGYYQPPIGFLQGDPVYIKDGDAIALLINKTDNTHASGQAPDGGELSERLLAADRSDYSANALPDNTSVEEIVRRFMELEGQAQPDPELLNVG